MERRGASADGGCVLDLLDTEPDRRLLVDDHDACLVDDDGCPLVEGNRAAKFYGLTPDEAGYPFYGIWHPMGVTAPIDHIIEKLENIIQTGKVVNVEFDNTMRMKW